MTSKKGSWIVWFVPFLLAGGMAFGAIIGMLSVSDATSQEGAAGDIAGALTAVMMLVAFVVGFVVTTLTLVVAKLMRRGAPDRIALRLGLSVVGGGVIGALGANQVDLPIGAAILLIAVPVALAWPSFAKAPPLP